MITQESIRNFCIIAHIDHGKSTLADRLLELTGSIALRNMKEQILDKMDLERERGITIKAKAVRMKYKAKDGREYLLNLIDTPGHVDFTYEVSRSLAACEGGILVVDASQGVEAQTLANTRLAEAQELKLVPFINKIDLNNADIEGTSVQLENILGFERSEMVLGSAKEGRGTEEILEAVIARVPPPQGDPAAPLQALIFDSDYDSYLGVVVFVRLRQGSLKKGQQILFMSNAKSYEVQEVGVMLPQREAVAELTVGMVGYIVANIKNVADVKVGDTVTDAARPTSKALRGYKEVKPMVFCGFYPIEAEQYEILREALEKLKLNDSSLFFEPENSVALGFGFRCGFLGLLHMDIVQERLEREYNLSLIATAPGVKFQVMLNDGMIVEVDSPNKMPLPHEFASMDEPYITAYIFSPAEFVGPVMNLCQNRRGNHLNTEYISKDRVLITYELPLVEVVLDFFDKLKSCTKGYASLDYEYAGYKPGELVKLDILVNEEPVDALAVIVHKDKAYEIGKTLAEKLKELIPRQMFQVPIQAAIGAHVIARENIPAMRKNVIAKCYGGDITRKRKLLEKQKEGKKRMKHVGRVDIPQEAFLAVLKVR